MQRLEEEEEEEAAGPGQPSGWKEVSQMPREGRTGAEKPDRW